MSYAPHGFDEDHYFGEESDCAALTTDQRAALDNHDQELALLAARQPQNEVPGLTW